jgi:hypothetical protein
MESLLMHKLVIAFSPESVIVFSGTKNIEPNIIAITIPNPVIIETYRIFILQQPDYHRKNS